MADRRVTRSRSRKTPAVIAYDSEETPLNSSTGNFKGSNSSKASSSAKWRPAAASTTSTTSGTRFNRAQILLNREKQKDVDKDEPHNKKSSSASAKEVKETKEDPVKGSSERSASSSSIIHLDASKPKTETSSEEPNPHPSTSMVPDSIVDMEDIVNVKKPKWFPTDWRNTLRYIRMMRAEKTAPVDTMGCERTMEENVEPKVINPWMTMRG